MIQPGSNNGLVQSMLSSEPMRSVCVCASVDLDRLVPSSIQTPFGITLQTRPPTPTPHPPQTPPPPTHPKPQTPTPHPPPPPQKKKKKNLWNYIATGLTISLKIA